MCATETYDVFAQNTHAARDFPDSWETIGRQMVAPN